MIVFPRGTPGVKAIVPVEFRSPFLGNWEWYLPGGKLIDGTNSRDSGHTSYIHVLRAGLLMGKATSGGKYRPSILGVMTGAQVATDTSVTVSAAQATEIVRRVGATGTLRFVGPPTAAGTVATFTETYSAVNTGTGVITCSGLNADLIAGSFVCADDGTYLPLTFIPPGAGVRVTDADGNSTDVPFERMPIGGTVDTGFIVNWPSDTSLRQWIADKLSASNGGKFTFGYTY
jgi:hypothetical protein